MYPEQQRLILIFVATLAMNPSVLPEIADFDVDAGLRGEKIYEKNAMHEICNFGAKGNCRIF